MGEEVGHPGLRNVAVPLVFPFLVPVPVDLGESVMEPVPLTVSHLDRDRVTVLEHLPVVDAVSLAVVERVVERLAISVADAVTFEDEYGNAVYADAVPQLWDAFLDAELHAESLGQHALAGVLGRVRVHLRRSGPC